MTSRTTAGRRQRAEKLGHQAERLAIWLLRLKGYHILEKRFRCSAGEIDLIVRRGKLLAFVEVKAREDAANASAAITPKQQKRIARAAESWLAAKPNLQNLNVRFDAVLVTPGTFPLWRWPHHIADAWRM